MPQMRQMTVSGSATSATQSGRTPRSWLRTLVAGLLIGALTRFAAGGGFVMFRMLVMMLCLSRPRRHVGQW